MLAVNVFAFLMASFRLTHTKQMIRLIKICVFIDLQIIFLYRQYTNEFYIKRRYIVQVERHIWCEQKNFGIRKLFPW